jgi:hypothetical protein
MKAKAHTIAMIATVIKSWITLKPDSLVFLFICDR